MTSVQFTSVGEVTKQETVAEKFMNIINRGKPVSDPALFFFLTGLFTVLIVLAIAILLFCLMKLFRRRSLRKTLKQIEMREDLERRE